ncbi:hypothetical protein OE165_27940, partial [Escherichia coli]|uniref:hypothetical protein n=1 Tax=Escherichia coli TaxID=562 RepID=UPI0021F345A6
FESNTFSQSEIQALYEFFISEDETSETNFFNLDLNDNDGYYSPTDLYHKFNKAFNLPDIFQINKVSAKTPDEVYIPVSVKPIK